MLGYSVTISRKSANRLGPTEPTDDRGESLIRWSCQPLGLNWIEELAATASGDGYPNRYTLRFSEIRRMLEGEDPPMAKAEAWRADPAVIASCDPDEWLIVVAWDQS